MEDGGWGLGVGGWGGRWWGSKSENNSDRLRVLNIIDVYFSVSHAHHCITYCRILVRLFICSVS